MRRMSFTERSRRAVRGEPVEAPEEASAQSQDERDDIQDPDAATQHTSGIGGLPLGLGGFADDGPGSSGRCAHLQDRFLGPGHVRPNRQQLK